jgi:hypothetical protein
MFISTFSFDQWFVHGSNRSYRHLKIDSGRLLLQRGRRNIAAQHCGARMADWALIVENVIELTRG